jgi:hypothetical protein
MLEDEAHKKDETEPGNHRTPNKHKNAPALYNLLQ